MELTHLLFDVKDEIATITLNRPEARNALSEEMRTDLDTVLAHIKQDAGETIKAVIITGAGKSFCAGGDVKGMKNRTPGADAGRRRMRRAHNRLYDLFNLELPVIAAVNGHAAGAGFSFALLADFILATPSSRFAMSFGRIGLVPDWAALYTLPRIVGLQKAKELTFTGRQFGADEAKAMGIVHAVVPEGALMDAARSLAGRFRNASPTAIGMAKVVLNQSLNLDHRAVVELEAMSQAIGYGTPYHQAAVKRFADKQPALFDWERADKQAAAE